MTRSIAAPPLARATPAATTCQTVLNVYQLLQRANDGAVNGVLSHGDAHLLDLAEDLFEPLNRAGT